MAGFSTYLSTEVLNWIKGTAFDTAPTNIYVSLHSGNPTDAGTANDVTTTINAAGRVEVTFGSITTESISNDAEVDFGNADGSAIVAWFGLWDASSGGNCLATGQLTNSRSVLTGDPIKFNVADLTVNLAS